MPVTLTMTEKDHQQLMRHLFPIDGCEAVALLLCGRRSGSRHRLLVREIALVPYSSCSIRTPDRVTWSTELLAPLLEKATKRDWALVKVHGHTDLEAFSNVDDRSDRDLFPSVYSWTEGGPHGSAILMHDGRAFGRVVSENGQFTPFERVSIVGDDITIHPYKVSPGLGVPEFGRRIAQTFGGGTFDRLRQLKVAVVGCSGTGSPVIEQLSRNCVGSLVLVDPDRVEEKNLNRILNTTWNDAETSALKVDVAKRAVSAIGLGTEVKVYARDLFDPEVVRAIADCDVIFGCMDTVDGRHLLNKLATFYLIPYFDLGVKIEADGLGGVNQVCGTVHYLKPGGSSLLSRRLYTLEQVRAAGLKRTAPNQYRELLEQGYIRGVQEDRPAVVQLNTLIASLAINELLARLHPYRLDPNGDYAINRLSLSHGIFDHEPDGEQCTVLHRHTGRGDVTPLLDWPELAEAAP